LRRIVARGSEVIAAFEQERDRMLVEFRHRLAARKIAPSSSGLSRFLRRLVITRKKETGQALEQDRPDILSKRRVWLHAQPALDPERLGFVD
jgi:hypothetical protein